ncbi:alkaline D-peptidase [Taibaiella sp. KBW10]|uniref:serine hydrolase domain-containing protein n=1 Tax=Taibaiella sp. KBW10 TaxID=2153357 RepID=UPI000F5911B0|nr:serine hydrolase domain-containing protein [Taibaiella sp. KBW10]RQO31406.1 alkaline D-peptidase [Taibaiella sp. KBW10]
MQKILDSIVDHQKVFGSSFAIKYKEYSWEGHSGTFEAGSQYFLGSTTKLFVTAIILQLQDKGLLQLDDPIEHYLDDGLLRDLHYFKGRDHSREITIKQLLSHTSGLPDYFTQKNRRSISLQKDLTSGIDRYWGLQEVITYSQELKPRFAPDTKGKAAYSDTNFQLLGQIIETICYKSFADCCAEMICVPLGLTDTYVFEDAKDTRPQALYYKQRTLHIPNGIASARADGGMVSTSKDLLVFTEAFFKGRLFSGVSIDQLKVWNRIFYPMRAGIGIQRFKLPWVLNPLGGIPDLYGHSGLSGALAYCNREQELYVAGTVNQIAYPDMAFRVMIRLIQQVLKH